MDVLLPVLPKIHFVNEWWNYIAPLIFIGLDFLSGFISAWIKKEIKSSKMRTGIAKKIGEFMMIVLMAVTTFCMGLPHQLITIVSAYIMFMEAISILENLSKLGVPVPAWIRNVLNNIEHEVDDGDYKKLSKDLNNYYTVVRYLCDKENTTVTDILESEEKKNDKNPS